MPCGASPRALILQTLAVQVAPNELKKRNFVMQYFVLAKETTKVDTRRNQESDMSGGWREAIGQYKCGCGAIYRKVLTTPFSSPDDVTCEVCGKQMHSWYNTTGFRSYELISRPL